MNPDAIALLKEWLGEFYFENFEGRYVECKLCGADDSDACDRDCLCRRTKDFLAEQTGDWRLPVT